MSDNTKKIYYDGYVGIGTDNPDQPLTVAGKENTFVTIKANNGEHVLMLGADGSGGIVSSVRNHDLQLRAGNNDTKVIIKSNGNVGVGTTNPQNKMHVVGGSTFQGGRNYFSDEENKGRLRVGAAWGIPGIYSEDGQDTIVGVGGNNKVFLGCDPNFVTIQGSNGHIGVGTREPTEKIHVENGFVKTRIYPGDDNTPALGGFVLEARNAGGGVHPWKLYTAPVGGGHGVPPNSFSIWDYPVGQHNQRFTIMPGNNSTPVVIDAKGNMAIGHWWDGANNTRPVNIGKADGSGGWGAGSAFIQFRDAAEAEGVNAGTNISFFAHGWNQSQQESMIIAGKGNVGIGNSAPQYKLDVNGEIRGNNVSPSDVRYKENIEPIADALGKVSALQGVSYTLKDKPQAGRQIGLVAQDVEKILPEVVSTDGEGYKSLAYDKLTALLIESVKELKAENELLRKRLDTLESR